MAGGKPVISTAIADVMAPYATRGLVSIASTAEEFATCGERALTQRKDSVWLERVDKFLEGVSWDNTWELMNGQLNQGDALQNMLA